MSDLRGTSVEVPNPELLVHHLESVINWAKQGELNRHEPVPARYWKALDLAHVALHLSGARVWDVNSVTGGSSVTPHRTLASEYRWARGPLTLTTVNTYLGIKDGGFPSTKLLVGLSARLQDFVVPASHFGNEGDHELITPTMRFSDLDPSSQTLTSAIFGLSAGFDTEFVHGFHDSSNPRGNI